MIPPINLSSLAKHSNQSDSNNDSIEPDLAATNSITNIRSILFKAFREVTEQFEQQLVCYKLTISRYMLKPIE